MSWSGLETMTGTGTATDLLSFPSIDFPIFWGLILFSLFSILSFKTYQSQLERTGTSNIWSSFAVAGFVTSLFALILSLFDIINSNVLVYSIGITITFVAIFILGKE